MGTRILGWNGVLWGDLDLAAVGYDVAETVEGERATDVFLRRNRPVGNAVQRS